MTRDEFKKIVKAIRGTYPNCPINNQQIFDLWYEMLKDLDYQTVTENLKRHIRSNKFAPAVAELRGVVDSKDFNNFKRRPYNMDALERQLLEADRETIVKIEVKSENDMDSLEQQLIGR
ncbi:replicative helicase loader/inhibitor [Faecalicatena contorta]|uniref:Loader and inhibitor of phage G40P n=1 Tax=Faecalicatena contorta TaxID=39482 RepID=A0A315ZV02_9FIRM|nr:replicative helicase loader/inhibitor [Faecalicatena contorta]PWJ49325.1 loader and inhibitor of G40P protein [Faecalicatena contorta]SUQ14569.1 Loader and inhibitor of phage G40P [Faecalicatena contorta]